MVEIGLLVRRTQSGDVEAYGEIVRRFQDMAYGYGYSILGDFSAAEDAAQESFIQAYKELGNLREPEAFPGWFRRIVYTQCAMTGKTGTHTLLRTRNCVRPIFPWLLNERFRCLSFLKLTVNMN